VARVLAILIIYLTQQLKFSDSKATAIYHTFVFMAYFSPLFGAILADGHIGKYRCDSAIRIVLTLGSLVVVCIASPIYCVLHLANN